MTPYLIIRSVALVAMLMAVMGAEGALAEVAKEPAAVPAEQDLLQDRLKKFDRNKLGIR